jgi:UPF0271 protein
MFLNVDAGELENEPEELYAAAQVVNIACGGHAGDEASMTRVLEFCKRFGTHAGAHPSYPDRANFGRKAMAIAPDALGAAVAEQCHALASCARTHGDVPIPFVKLHGALYHAANGDRALARAALKGIIEALGWEITVIGPGAGETIDAARALGLRYAREGFADRGMRADGSLVPRGEAGAMIDDPARAAEQARALVKSGAVDTICVHGDGKNALAVARAVRAVIA